MTTGSAARRRHENRAGRANRVNSSRTSSSRTTSPPHALNGLAAAGFVARGVTYALIGVLALAIAFGKAAPEADRTGALQAVAAQPFGKILLWLLVIGFAAMALWRFAQAGYGVDGRGRHGAAEAQAAARGAVYAVFCFGTFEFVHKNKLPQSTNQQSQDFTSTAMAHSGGRILVGVVGAVILGIGAYMIRNGLTKAFRKDLQFGTASRRTRENVLRLGMIGNTARGVVFAAVGMFMIVAAVRFDPAEAKGIDATLRSFAHTPLGPWLLAVVAVGLFLFGVYSICEARWHRSV
jgi:Domain of Unknown Function (DUF1206)